MHAFMLLFILLFFYCCLFPNVFFFLSHIYLFATIIINKHVKLCVMLCATPTSLSDRIISMLIAVANLEEDVLIVPPGYFLHGIVSPQILRG